MAKILIIEDDAAIAAIEKDYLELSGYEVSVCADGVSGLTAALDAAREFSFIRTISMYGNAAHLSFATQYPRIPTYLVNEYYDSLEAFANAMVSGQDAVDVLQLYTGGAPIRQLIDKGYAMDMSGNADIMAAIGGMYPALMERYLRDGKVYALPVNLYVSSLGYSRSALEELGLTQEDLPKTWMELLDFMAIEQIKTEGFVRRRTLTDEDIIPDVR